MKSTPRDHPRTSEVIARVREFNRFYTRRIGVLRPNFLGSDFSLTEVRVLYELANHRGIIARDLVEVLGLDRGYVSRLLKSFETRGIVERRRIKHDGRSRAVTLTSAGRKCFAGLDAQQTKDMELMLRGLSHDRRQRLTAAMSTIRRILTETKP